MPARLGSVLCIATLALNTPAMAAGAANPLPSPVRTCEDIRAYIDADNSMTMDTFKKLLIASDRDLGGQGEQALDNQCMMTAYAKSVTVESEYILTKEDGGKISVTTQVIKDKGVCKLVNLFLTGC
jgi:hypothetical protein